MENDGVIKNNKVIGKALERSKINLERPGEKVISLNDTVREPRQRTREAKKMAAVVGQKLEVAKKNHEIDSEVVGENSGCVLLCLLYIIFFSLYTY